MTASRSAANPAAAPFHKLQTYKTQAKDPKCVINADAGADFKHVVVVLDEVRRIGIAKVGINTDKK